ncbi:MAG TPA: class I SAM-dependent methyltransferase [Candidatus Brocadiia bacterium]|nr:class I SAM-dependent methyltransferase [Candidatus Brocadiia bacterium]
MEPAEIQKLDEMTERHWWYRSRLKLVRAMIQRRAGASRITRALEIGCGCGGNMVGLADLAENIAGLDLSADCLDRCRARGIGDIAQADAAALPFPDGAFDAAFMLDVLEHFEDETPSLLEARRVLSDKGVLYVTVPALQGLWSVHDEAFHHKRRYSSDGLRTLIQNAGFRVETITYWSSLPLLPVFIQRKLRSARGNTSALSDFHLPQPWPLPQIFAGMQALERSMIIGAGLRPPAGVSLFACATVRK